ncbi:MAG: cytochrome c3 family protein [Caulobacterales bacterium]|nr:cytochrome c3 family protein [Caulobacterales bacterium]
MPAASRLLSLVGLLLVLCLGLSTTSSAQTLIEKLVSPGPLAAAHARFEARCQSCHQSFKKDAQSGLCLGCHKPVATDIAARTGYHGRNRKIPGAVCSTCHTDHAGRGGRLVLLDPAGFNHTLTDYPLKGGHLRVACASCHKPGVKFRAAPTACASCHAARDPHKGKLGPGCASCHSETGWKDVRFNHASTGFSLVGAHARPACLTCHADKTFQGASSACASCHAKDDAHKGTLGSSCASCHGTITWKPARFDHDRTGFSLGGAHARVACDSCHAQGRYRGTQPACIGCHRDKDVHAGRLGAACANCHNASGWKVTRFDHGKTGFALSGGHTALTCGACHGPAPAREAARSTACASCHAAEDVHKGGNGTTCEQCHQTTSWKTATFDHNRQTRFPLLGAHGGIVCATCHRQSPREVRLGTACIDCHRPDDAHVGQLGADCASCHAPLTWKSPVRFDHGLSVFPLVGKHAGLACATCHKSPRFKDAPADCAGCHRKDDPHKGAYEGDCAGCHNPGGWAHWSFDHGRTTFPLDGRHTDLACRSCHRPGRPRPASTCGSCHQADDIHLGAFGPGCGQCHTTGDFRTTRPSF